MYSQSRKWIAPKVLKDDQNKRMNNARRKVAPNSVAWEPNLDLHQHKKEFADLQQAQWERTAKRHADAAAERLRLGLPSTPPAIKPAFGGKVYSNNRSSVLAYKTIFSTKFEEGREGLHATNGTPLSKAVADWPSKSEMKYEGDDRIATDKLHRRFLGAPRVVGNETVNWQKREIVPQYRLDDFYYPQPEEPEIYLNQYWIREHQFSDLEGVEALGMDLMDAIYE